MCEQMPSDKEMINNLIDRYADIQRIRSADDREKELEYQLMITKAKLESFGISLEELSM